MSSSTKNINSLVRGRVRPSMNKHNLFNLYKKTKPYFRNMTLYQQKWASKQETRAYHGEHIRESRWQTLFDKKLEGVAQLDASLKGESLPTPMVNQTYAPLEKRLDFAVFRALFASSVRQAKKFILNGHVSVNNVVIKYPGYTLKPGDVFSVEPERVLEALGTKKPSIKESYKVDKMQVIKWQEYVNSVKENPRKVWSKKLDKQKKLQSMYADYSVEGIHPKLTNDGSLKSRIEGMDKFKLAKMKEIQNSISRTSILTDIINTVKVGEPIDNSLFISQFGSELSMKAHDIAQALPKAIFTLDSKGKSEEVNKIIPTYKDGKVVGEVYNDTAMKKVRQQVNELNTLYLEKVREDFTEKPLSETELISIWSKNLKKHSKIPEFSEVEEKGSYDVNLPWQKGMYGLNNPSKNYFTPWKPRQFLPVFAILPKHIEVSFTTCHAVYLRDPVARPGESEVISPFDEDVHERAYMYYQKGGM